MQKPSNMKKILIITNSLSLDDGLGRYSGGLIDGLKKIYKLVILSPILADAKERYSRDKNIEIYKIAETRPLFNPIYNFLYSWRLLKFFTEADFVHSCFDYPYCLLPFWNPFFKKPVFITAHGTYSVLPLDRFKSKFFLRRAFKKAEKILCVSSFTESRILKRIKLNNTMVINNGVDYERFARMSGVERENRTILSVGVLKPRKGYSVSIPAVAEAKKKYKDIKYYIVGGRPSKIYLDLVKKHNLEDNVKFLYDMPDEELIKLYHKCTLFLLTPITINDNDFEGFGQVFLEAGSCGAPVVGTSGCGAEDAIIDGKTGFLVPQNDVKKTAEAVLKLLDDPQLARELGKNGKKRAREMSWENIAKNYIGAYKI